MIFLPIGIIIGAIVIAIILAPKAHRSYIEDKEARAQDAKIKREIELLESKREELTKSIDLLEEQANKSAELAFKQSYEIANTAFENNSIKLATKAKLIQEEMETEYLNALEESALDFSQQLTKKKEELQQLDKQLEEARRAVSASVEASKRAMEMREKEDFYKIKLSEIDLEEIKRLREVSVYLRDKEPLNKVIWKVYYEKPTNDLIGRVIGTGIHTGIYKITNVQNQMTYVGQSVNLSDRWKQHIKRGIGADAPTRNKLYPAMLEYGVENFTFEVIEECEKSELDAREDYWQDYYQSTSFGYSIK